MMTSTATAGRVEPASMAPMQDFRVDGWLVQTARNRLVKGPTDIRVRPQLIDVLACLAAQPGRVVSKNHLLSVVWSDRYVASTGIARCMAELRQVLQDDARNPRIIETIPKRGYRLIAAVEPVEGEDGQVQSPAAVADHRIGEVSPPVMPRLRGALSLARVFLTAGAAFSVFVRHVARAIGH